MAREEKCVCYSHYKKLILLVEEVECHIFYNWHVGKSLCVCVFGGLYEGLGDMAFHFSFISFFHQR